VLHWAVGPNASILGSPVSLCSAVEHEMLVEVCFGCGSFVVSHALPLCKQAGVEKQSKSAITVKDIVPEGWGVRGSAGPCASCHAPLSLATWKALGSLSTAGIG
jgi:hypothetical protein